MLKRERNSGQVSIFLVLIFQVLFVFFAMIVNIGLLVYYKINLQNSVDLSAYYAGVKQAEILNSIGHINYQLRQNWKLYSYRMMILGTLGIDAHIGKRIGDTRNLAHSNPPPEGPPLGADGEIIIPIFCVTIAEIYGNTIGADPQKQNSTDNQCKKTGDYTLRNFQIPKVIYNMSAHNAIVRGGALALQNQFLEEFSAAGIRNFYIAAVFTTLFRADSLNRRKVIGVLANELSRSTEEFEDLQNVNVKTAAQNMLKHNLADQNSVGLTDFALYNSMADPACNSVPPRTKEALPSWLRDIDIAVMPQYFDSRYKGTDDNAEDINERIIKTIGNSPTDDPNDLQNPIPSTAYSNPGIRDYLTGINDLLLKEGHPDDPNNRWTSTVGVEKNPWCMPYVGIKAETSPRLPFLPNSLTPKLVAKAFTKPFGATIGPWYSKLWPKGAPMSESVTGTGKIDMAMGYRLRGGGSTLPNPTTNQEKISLMPLYSRFPGDQWGLYSDRPRWAYGQFYWLYDPTTANPFDTRIWMWSFEQGHQNHSDPKDPFYKGPDSQDILAEAWDNSYFPFANTRQKQKMNALAMRKSEIAAIAPDLFDATYYSIEPRFNEDLLKRIQGFVRKHNTFNPNLAVRGDFGWRPNPPAGADPEIAGPEANIESQLKQFKNHDFYKKTPNEIYQTLSNWTHVLTSWAEKSIVSYDPAISRDKIAECKTPRPPNDPIKYPWTSGDCLMGGRTGYSVKLVSKKFLNEKIPDLGGEGLTDTIMNPPPDEEDF